MTRFDRVTKATAFILAMVVIVIALPFIILSLLLASIAGMILWAAGVKFPKYGPSAGGDGSGDSE